VARVSVERGYAFIACPPGKDLFCGDRQWPPGGLTVGERVPFRRGTDAAGRPRALEVQRE
jgi:hypothetical protein